MVAIEQAAVEKAIIKIIEEINENLEYEINVVGGCSPGAFFKSHVLVTAMGRIARILDVVIPNNCYIFSEKQNNRQNTIIEAAQKLIKVAKPLKTKDGNK